MISSRVPILPRFRSPAMSQTTVAAHPSNPLGPAPRSPPRDGAPAGHRPARPPGEYAPSGVLTNVYPRGLLANRRARQHTALATPDAWGELDALVAVSRVGLRSRMAPRRPHRRRRSRRARPRQLRGWRGRARHLDVAVTVGVPLDDRQGGQDSFGVGEVLSSGAGWCSPYGPESLQQSGAFGSLAVPSGPYSSLGIAGDGTKLRVEDLISRVVGPSPTRQTTGATAVIVFVRLMLDTATSPQESCRQPLPDRDARSPINDLGRRFRWSEGFNDKYRRAPTHQRRHGVDTLTSRTTCDRLSDSASR